MENWGFVVLGAFYVFAGVVGARAAMMEAIMDAAIAGIAAKRRDRIDVERTWWLGVFTVLVGAGGALLLARSALAGPVFVASAAAQALYLMLIAPRHFDVDSPPDAKGRRQTWNAFWIYLVATGFVVWAWATGRLQPFGLDPAVDWPAWLALAVSLAGAAKVAHFLLTLQRRPATAGLGGFSGFGGGDEDWPLDPQPAGSEDLSETHFYVSPSWGPTCLYNAFNQRMVSWDEARPFFPELLLERGMALVTLYQALADPDCPTRDRLLNAEDWEHIHADAGSLAAAMNEHRPGKVFCERWPCSHIPEVSLRRVLIRAEAGSWALWHDDPEDRDNFGAIDPEWTGRSWALTRALEDWTARFDESLNWDDPAQGMTWSASEEAAHCAEGLALARRFAAELAASGYAHVAVRYVGSDGVETVVAEGERPDGAA